MIIIICVRMFSNKLCHVASFEKLSACSFEKIFNISFMFQMNWIRNFS